MPTCLIVDDSKIVRKLARRIVESLGFEVMEAEHGQHALEVCAERMPDLIVLDWYMPVMDGITFLKNFRSTVGGDAPKIVMCTTENEFSHIMQAMQAGANEYVMKPFDADILRGKLEQIGAL
jgi:two-component system, chemotaxis family, chemotaxis protein CheY